MTDEKNEEKPKAKPEVKKTKKRQFTQEDFTKIFGVLGRELKGKELDKSPVSRTELNTQLSVMSAIIAELYLTVVSQKKEMRKRVTYRIRLGGEIDLFITCDEKKYKEMMRQLRKETAKLLRDLQPFNTMLGGEVYDEAVPDEDDDKEKKPSIPQDRSYA